MITGIEEDRNKQKVELTLQDIYRAAGRRSVDIRNLPLNFIMESVHEVLRDEPFLVFNDALSRFLYESYTQGYLDAPETIGYETDKDMVIRTEEMDQVFFRITEDDFYEVLRERQASIDPDLKEDVNLLIDDILNDMKKQKRDWLADIVDKVKIKLDSQSGSISRDIQ